MTETTQARRASSIKPAAAPRYDTVTIWLHWITLVLVAEQWLGAELIDFIPGKPAHQLYWSIHITLGVLLALTVATHLWWRSGRGKTLPDANSGVWAAASRAMLLTLTLLPALVVLLGIGIILARGWTLFGALTIPALPGGSRPLARTIHGIHEWAAHVLVFLAASHAVAALVHHYVLKDRLLNRMLPAAAPPAP